MLSDERNTISADIVSINFYYFLMVFRIARNPMPPRKTIGTQNP